MQYNYVYSDADKDIATILDLPKTWDVTVVGNLTKQRLATEDIIVRLSDKVMASACNKKSACIIVDDSSRPTPANVIVTHIVTCLHDTGIRDENIFFVVSHGTHAPDSETMMRSKIGEAMHERFKVIPHDCRNDCVQLGISSNGIPVSVNKHVYEADLRIGVSCVVPHPAAGFSGGNKIVAPGVCGYETIRALHDECRGCKQRAGKIETEFRATINEIAGMVGLDLSANVIINSKREIVELFCGDPESSFKEAVKYVRSHHSVKLPRAVDLLIIDTYPCDRTVNLAMDRAFWPLFHYGTATEKVVLAECRDGMGGHELFSTKQPFMQRLKRRLAHFSTKEMLCLPERVFNIVKMLRKFSVRFSVISSVLRDEELQRSFKNATVIRAWDDFASDFMKRRGRRRIRVVIVRSAPLVYQGK
ncbi:MAG: DUF2088 domain-containing protein [Candidatus Omnitrophica bacterium]|nr:DUF2088 domain-containing protein [Candidatus Omnitrophota bacterium]